MSRSRYIGTGGKDKKKSCHNFHFNKYIWLVENGKIKTLNLPKTDVYLYLQNIKLQ